MPDVGQRCHAVQRGVCGVCGVYVCVSAPAHVLKGMEHECRCMKAMRAWMCACACGDACGLGHTRADACCEGMHACVNVELHVCIHVCGGGLYIWVYVQRSMHVPTCGRCMRVCVHVGRWMFEGVCLWVHA